LKQLIIIPNDGFRDASYKNWGLLKSFYKTKFTALAKLMLALKMYYIKTGYT